MTAAHDIDLPALLAERLTTTHPDVLRELLSTFIHTLMGAEADALCGAAYGQRSAERTNSRNGYRHRQFDTRAGSLDVAIPKSCGRATISEPPRDVRRLTGAVQTDCAAKSESIRRWPLRGREGTLSLLPASLGQVVGPTEYSQGATSALDPRRRLMAGRRAGPIYLYSRSAASGATPPLLGDLTNRQPLADDRQHGLIPLLSHAQLLHAKECQGSTEATVKHQPKHCQGSPEAKMSSINRGHTRFQWGGRGSNPRPTDYESAALTN